MATKNGKLAGNAGAMGIGLALAVVITQSLSAAGVDLGSEIVGPLGVVLQGVVHAIKDKLGVDDA